MIEADHYSKVKGWRWPAFSPQEIACRGTGKLRIDPAAMDKLQALRTRLAAPMIINSAYRSPEHNRKVGGAKNSQHLLGIAFDVSMANHDPEVFEREARACGFTGFGFYPPGKGDFIHLDTGKPRTWGTRWKAPKHAPEPKARMVSAPAAAATAAPITVAALFEGAKQAAEPENLAAIQAVVQPMIPYASIFQSVFVACGVGIVLWTVWKRFFRKAP